MKLILILAVVALLAVLLVCLLQAVSKHNLNSILTTGSKRSRVRYRQLNSIERLFAPAVLAMKMLFAPPEIHGGSRLALANTTANSSGYRTFQATSTAIILGKRVKVDSNGLISVAAAAEAAIGVTVEDVAASGYGTVKLWNAGGTFIMWANAAITRGAQLYPTASGGIDDAGTTALPLVALEAATAQGDLIEVAPAYLGA